MGGVTRKSSGHFGRMCLGLCPEVSVAWRSCFGGDQSSVCGWWPVTDQGPVPSALAPGGCTPWSQFSAGGCFRMEGDLSRKPWKAPGHGSCKNGLLWGSFPFSPPPSLKGTPRERTFCHLEPWGRGQGGWQSSRLGWGLLWVIFKAPR